MSPSRILIITRNLPPLVGGMERLNWHMADELSKFAQVRVIGPSGAAVLKPDNVKVLEAPLKPLPFFLLIAFLKALWLSLRWKPDVILAGSGLTAPLAWLISKSCRARSAAYLHGFDITVRNKLYQRLWAPVFGKMDSVIVNSTPTRLLAFAAGVPEAKIGIVYPGVSLPETPQPAENIAAFKQRHDLENKKILLSVGRLTTRKGLREFVEHALPEIVAVEPNAVLVVIGEVPKNSLGAGIQSVESIQEQARKSGVAEHVRFLGVITDKTGLATAYEAADIHVFPVRYIPDDPEGFGMVAIEAAAHGLPTVAFATGGVVDAVKHGVSGYLAKQDDYAEFYSRVTELLRRPLEKNKTKGFAQMFEWGSFGKNIDACLKNALLAENAVVRQAHAVTDLSSRVPKAQKIEKLLDLCNGKKATLKLLEIGCGSGGIAHYFATREYAQFEVEAVDIYDNRKVFGNYKFQLVDGAILPFMDKEFDIVISNHVVEHVGNREMQIKHLAEIKRVLRPDGIGYLAVPNRWMIVEPHYRLVFLSWLPRSWRSGYLKIMKKGEYYDCEPLELSELEEMLKIAGVEFRNICTDGLRATLDIEKPNRLLTKIIRNMPDAILNALRPVIPTLIYHLRQSDNS